MDKLLKLTGCGETSKAPDIITISLNILGENKDYNDAMSECDKKVMSLKESLKSVGLEDSQIKTTDFRVKTINKYVEQFKQGKYVFDKFSVSHSLSVKLPFDLKLLARSIDKIVESNVSPNFSIHFSVEDEKLLKERAIAEAVKDCKEKADILAESAGVKLKDIVSIDHSFQQVNVYMPRAMSYDYEAGSVMTKASQAIESINVEDIKIRANVTMQWEID